MGKQSITIFIAGLAVVSVSLLAIVFFSTKNSPEYLSSDEIGVVKDALGMKFPESTSKVWSFLNRDHDFGVLYCCILFDINDLENFKDGRADLATTRDPNELFLRDLKIRSETIPPERIISGIIPRIERMGWWITDPQQVDWFYDEDSPKSKYCILIGKPQKGQVRVCIKRDLTIYSYPKLNDVFQKWNTKREIRETSP
jgi:hypothetical protein